MSAFSLMDMALETDPDLHRFFLGRLASLAARHAASVSSQERTALSTAMFSIYLDCLDLGLGAEAQTILAQFRNEPATTERQAA